MVILYVYIQQYHQYHHMEPTCQLQYRYDGTGVVTTPASIYYDEQILPNTSFLILQTIGFNDVSYSELLTLSSLVAPVTFLLTGDKGQELTLGYMGGLVNISGTRVEIPVEAMTQIGPLFVDGDNLELFITSVPALAKCGDVSLGTLVTSDILQYNGLEWTNVNIGLPSGAIVGTTDSQALTNKTLTDPTNSVRATQVMGVVLPGTAPATNQVLKTTSATTSAYTNFALASLNDASISSPVSGNLLRYTGTAWSNANIGLPTGAIVGTTDSQALTNKTLTDPTNSVRATQVVDVILPGTAPATNQVLKTTSATTSAYTNFALASLNDATITTPATGNLLRYNGTVWANANIGLPTGAIVGTTDSQALTNKDLTDSSNTVRATQIRDVITPSNAAAANQILKTTGVTTSSWIPYALSTLNDTNIVTPISGNILRYNGTAWVNYVPASVAPFGEVASATLNSLTLTTANTWYTQSPTIGLTLTSNNTKFTSGDKFDINNNAIRWLGSFNTTALVTVSVTASTANAGDRWQIGLGFGVATPTAAYTYAWDFISNNINTSISFSRVVTMAALQQFRLHYMDLSSNGKVLNIVNQSITISSSEVVV